MTPEGRWASPVTGLGVSPPGQRGGWVWPGFPSGRVRSGELFTSHEAKKIYHPAG